jgi:hypothetical protein
MFSLPLPAEHCAICASQLRFLPVSGGAIGGGRSPPVSEFIPLAVGEVTLHRRALSNTEKQDVVIGKYSPNDRELFPNSMREGRTGGGYNVARWSNGDRYAARHSFG